MLIETIKPENLPNFPERIVLHFLTRVCESSAPDFCVLLLRICKVKCDWSRKPEVMEIVSWLEFVDQWGGYMKNFRSIALFTVSPFYMHYNVTQHVCEAISG